MKSFSWLASLAIALAFVLGLAPEVLAQAAPPAAPAAADFNALLNSVDLKAPIQSPTLTSPIQIIILLAGLSLLPFIVIMTTSFVRTVIVLAFLKQAMGLQNIPPGQVIIGTALFLSMYTMAPTWDAINKQAVEPFLANRIHQQEFIAKAAAPIQQFMVRQTSQVELSFFLRLAKEPDPKTPAEVPFHVLVPAFLVSELTTGFKIGFIIYLPFIVVDLVITNVIMALGMQQLQTQMLAPPFKVLIFSLANGWHLVVEAIIKSFR